MVRIKKILNFVIKSYFISYLIWFFLTSISPKLFYNFKQIHDNGHGTLNNLGSINSFHEIYDSDVYFVIAHPDDELMFFFPSLIELINPVYRNNVKLICFSHGESESDEIGLIRKKEFYVSGKILGLEKKSLIIMNKFKDGLDIEWNFQEISFLLNKEIKLKSDKRIVIITFDKYGVSNHINHKSLYYGVKFFFEENNKQSNYNHDLKNRLYVLKSLNFFNKYSSTIFTNLNLIVKYLIRFLNFIFRSDYNPGIFSDPNSSEFFSDYSTLSLNYASMLFGYKSQMKSYRYLWLFFSRYVTYNNLVQII